MISIVNTKNNCKLNPFSQLVCQCSSKEDFGSIFLYFDNSNFFEIKLSNIIDYSSSWEFQCKFQLLIDNLELNTWILGDSALRGSILTFDINKRQISFIQNIQQSLDDNNLLKEKIYNENNNDISSYLFYGIILSIIIIILIIIFK